MVEVVELHQAAKTRHQRTIGREVVYSGIGLHTGEVVTMRFSPAKEGRGVIFRRSDLPGSPEIPATLEYVCDTSDRCTVLGVDRVRIYTVEHVLAALKGSLIDNVYVDISNIEPPIAEGSSSHFISLLEEAGFVEQEAVRPILQLKKPIFWANASTQIVALPYPSYRISNTLHYSDANFVKTQFQSFVIDPETFKREISPCRTFSRYEEISQLIERGLIKGGSLDNAVVMHGEATFSKGGLYFPDEMVRHKILDMVGDLSLIGLDFHAHILAIRSGHASNYAFANVLLNALTTE